MSALPNRSDLAGSPSKSTLQTILLGLYDMVAQRLAAGTTGAGTASAAELKTARDSLGLGAGADIASAATLDLTSRGNEIIRVTGTTAITALSMNNGQRCELVAVAALPLTYDATNMPLKGGFSYTCAAGDRVVVFRDGNGDYGAEVFKKDGQAMSVAQPGTVAMFAMSSAPAGWLKANGAAVSRTTYAALFAAIFKQSTATISIASPGVVTWNSHGLAANDPVRFSTTGALPTGLVANTTYYVVAASITTNTFQLSATSGGAAINTSGTQSGTHTAISAPFGVGDGSTTFNVPDLRGEFIRGLDDGRGVDANRSIGSAQSDQNKAHTHAPSAGGSFYSNGGGSGDVNGAGSTLRTSATTTSDGGSEARPRSIALLACIKF